MKDGASSGAIPWASRKFKTGMHGLFRLSGQICHHGDDMMNRNNVLPCHGHFLKMLIHFLTIFFYIGKNLPFKEICKNKTFV